MTLYEYSHVFDAAKTGRAQTYDANVSYKDLTQVCLAIKGKPIEKARKILDSAATGKFAIPYRSHAKGTGHRKELGGKRGRYPKNESELVRKILDNAYANAQSKGVDEKTLVVLHAAAFKQNTFPRYRRFFVGSHTLGYGKQAVFSNYSTARLELVVGPAGLKPAKRPTEKQLKLAKKLKKSAPKGTKGEKKAEDKKPAEAKPAAPHTHPHDEKAGPEHAAAPKIQVSNKSVTLPSPQLTSQPA